MFLELVETCISICVTLGSQCVQTSVLGISRIRACGLVV